MTARLGFADHIKIKGINEDTNAFIELTQASLTAIF
ncbi:MAG: hypothetical protein ACI9N3_003020 [Colwellia sp.]|jgi:hypothetical protein